MRGVLVRTRAVSVCACLGTLLGLAGCGAASTKNSTIIVSGSSLTVYASQPPGGSGGQAATDVLEGEQLALRQAGGAVGKYKLRLVKLDGRELSDNARTAISDKTAIAYLGELQPGTSQVSVQILNQQGLLEVSPLDTAVYLTQPTPAVSDSPTKFYPARSTYHETFARVVPNSAAEAKAQAVAMKSASVSHLYVTNDGQPYGQAIALEVADAARAAGISVTAGPATAAGVRSSGANAVFYGASIDSPAVRRVVTSLLDVVSASLPSVKLFVPSGLDDNAFVSTLSSAAQSRLVVSAPGIATKDLVASGRKFVSDFTAAYGHGPAPQAIFGYAAMQAVLASLTSAGVNAGNRAAVVAAARELKNTQSVLGSYSIAGGDPNTASFIFARPQGGKLVPVAKG